MFRTLREISCAFLCIFVLTNFENAKVHAESHCVVVQNCPQLHNLLVDPSQRERAKDLVRQSNCGYDGFNPKVLCELEECWTPDEHSGFCKPLKNCAPISKILNNDTLVKIATKDYLRQLRCTFPGETLAVCCPTNKNKFFKQLFHMDYAPNLLPDPNTSECGRQGKNRIIHNGEIPDINEFPWTVRLHYEKRSNQDVICSGSLINNRYVITAAHCVDKDIVIKHLGKLDRVTLGEYNIDSEIDCIGIKCADPPVIVQVESVTVHPDYYTQRRQLINNDIALIRLAKPVEFSQSISPICLPEANLVLRDDQELSITGWRLNKIPDVNNIKLKALVYKLNRNVCEQTYRGLKQLTVGDGAFCAEEKEGSDACTGDSGGPVMLNAQNADGTSTSFLAGIISFGLNQQCEGDYFPGLYTFTPKYIDWIEKTIRP